MARTINPKGIRTNHTTVRQEGSRTIVRLYSTDIVTIDRAAGTVTLYTGGYTTPTTMRRMNEVIHHYGLKLAGHPTYLGSSDFRTTDKLTFELA